MKIAAWNCHNNWNSKRNFFDDGKIDKLDLVDKIGADVFFLSEVADDHVEREERGDSRHLECYHALKDLQWANLPKDRRGVGFYCRNGYTIKEKMSFNTENAFGVCAVVTDSEGHETRIMGIWNYPGIKRLGYLENMQGLFQGPYRKFLSEDTVIIGDFNVVSWKEGQSKKEEEKYHQEMQQLLGFLDGYQRLEGEEGGFTNVTKRKIVEAPELTYEIKNRFAIDFAFVPKSWGNRAKLLDNSSFLDYAFREHQVSPSDHLPIIVEIS